MSSEIFINLMEIDRLSNCNIIFILISLIAFLLFSPIKPHSHFHFFIEWFRITTTWNYLEYRKLWKLRIEGYIFRCNWSQNRQMRMKINWQLNEHLYYEILWLLKLRSSFFFFFANSYNFLYVSFCVKVRKKVIIIVFLLKKSLYVQFNKVWKWKKNEKSFSCCVE